MTLPTGSPVPTENLLTDNPVLVAMFDEPGPHAEPGSSSKGSRVTALTGDRLEAVAWPAEPSLIS
jgi:hypothetical protein